MDAILTNYITSSNDPFNFIFQNFFSLAIGDDQKILLLAQALPVVSGRLELEDYQQWMEKTTR